MTPTEQELAAFIERIEAQNQRIAEETEARAEIFMEAKSRGYSTPILREIIKLRKMSPDDRAERETVLETYLAALGMA
jgi:uncharacterized protein (UPF0335 family)